MPLTPEELRKAFRSIDTDNSGSISEKELREAMLALGVKVSGNSAKRVLAIIDKDGNGTIEFPEFQAFFGKVSNPDEIKKLLSVENQRFFEYKMMVESDPSFAKTFAIPPTVPQSWRLDAHAGDVEGLAWISDTQLLSASIDGAIHLWDLAAEGKPSIAKHMQCSSLYSLAASPDSARFLTGHGLRSSNLNLWSIEEGAITSRLEGHNEPVYSCTWSGDGGLCASGSKTGRICLHSLTSEGLAQDWKGHSSVVRSIKFRSGGGNSVLCSSSRDGTVKVFDTRTSCNDYPQFVIEDAAASGPVNEALWRGESEIVSCGDDYCIKRWDVRQSGKGPVASYFGHTSVVRAIALSGDGRFLASGTQSGSARVWLADELGLLHERGVEARQRQAELEAAFQQMEARYHDDGEGDLEDLKDASKKLTAAKDELGFLRQVQSEREIMACTQAVRSLDGPTLPINALAWRDLTDGTARVACGCQDESIRVFRLDLQALGSISSWAQPSN